jgi:hypothetical protein
MIATYDLGIAWEWTYDADFIALLEAACHARGLTCCQITPTNRDSVTTALVNGTLRFRVFFDRASDADPLFMPLVAHVRALIADRINDFTYSRRAWDKATMHLELLQAGLELPHTIILPPFAARPDPALPDMTPLGIPFNIKPAHGGGGEGVITLARSWEEVQAARQQFPHDKYLLTAWVDPMEMEGRRAWFRIVYAGGQVFPLWFDDRTHVHIASVTAAEEERLGLAPLRDISNRIAQVTQLDLFSSEVALTPQGRFVTVDYVNDPLDLRPQSRTPQGLPDATLHHIADALADHIRAVVKRQMDSEVAEAGLEP